MDTHVEDCFISTTGDDGSPYTIHVSGDALTVSRRGETWTGALVYSASGDLFVGIEWSESEGEPEPDANEIDMVEQILAGDG